MFEPLLELRPPRSLCAPHDQWHFWTKVHRIDRVDDVVVKTLTGWTCPRCTKTVPAFPDPRPSLETA